jgi:hypothetical protein
MPLPLFIIFISFPTAALIWASVHGLHVGRAPIFWFAVTIDRQSRPRLYWGVMELTIIAAAASTLVASWMIAAAFG